MLFCFTQNGNLNSAKFEVIIKNTNTSSVTIDALQLGFFFPLLKSSGSLCDMEAVPTYIPPLRNTYFILINGTRDKLLKS